MSLPLLGRRALRKPSLGWLAFTLGAALPAGAAHADDLRARGIPSIRVFGSDVGLPQSTAQAIAFEPSGRLWVGTQAGAAHSDGARFTPLSPPRTERSTSVLSLAASRDGSVWFGTNGAGVFRYAGEQFTTYTEADGLPSTFVWALAETLEGGAPAVWAGTSAGLSRRKGERWAPVDLGPGFRDAPVHVLASGALPSGEPTLWVGTGAGLSRCAGERCAPFATVANGLPHSTVQALLATTDEHDHPILWVGTSGGLARHDGERWDVFTTASGALLDDDVRALAETVSGSGQRTLWVGTMAGGLARLQGGTWTSITLANSGLPSNQIWSLAATGGELGARTLWIGTGSGLARLRHDGWTSFTAKSADLPSADVMGIAERAAPDGTSEIWLGVSDRLVRLSDRGRRTEEPRSAGLRTLWIYALLSPRREPSALWLGTERDGAGRMDGDGGPMTLFTSSSSPLPGDSVFSLGESLDGRALWFGTNQGAARLEGDAWQVVPLGPPPQPNNRIRVIRETAGPGGRPTAWFGTEAGLFRWEDGELSTCTAATTPLGNDQIYALAEVRDARGARVLWIGTQGGGIARYDLDAGVWREPLTTTTRPPLPDNTIYQIQQDADQRLYLFTNHGIARLTPRAPTPDDPAEFSVYTFTTEDGLPSDECNWNSALIDRRGRVWAGTVSGAAMLAPDEEVDDRTPKPLLLAPTRVAGRAAPLAPGEELPWDQNTLSFGYTLRSFFRESDTRYQTQLLGFDPAPSAWGTEPLIRYTNLPEGAYTFQVRARDYAGNVSGPASVAFRVRAALFRTRWAYLGYALGLLGLVYASMRVRLRALGERNRALEAHVASRTAELDRKNGQLVENLVAVEIAHAETERKNRELDRKNEQLAENVSALEAARAETERKNRELDLKVAELARKNEELVASHERADRIFSALADVLPGAVLDGKYHLERKIGAGGFGAVFQAVHVGLGRNVAVKIFRPAQGNDSAISLERFRQEGESACRVSHPNAVQVFDAGISREGIAYIVMELLSGRTLADELAERGAVPLRRAARILTEVCGALAAAHLGGILHRDIKPENIFLHQGPEGEVVKVVDFGIAKLMGAEGALMEQTWTGGLLGTPSYIAPERIRSESYDARSDIYSVGVTVFEMVSGALPYLTESPIEQLMQKLSQPPRDLEEQAPWVPAQAREVVMRCLSDDPAGRPALEELAGEFARAVAALPGSTQDAEPWRDRPAEPRRADPMAATLAVSTAEEPMPEEPRAEEPRAEEPMPWSRSG
jgi:ligand-binding sensor domain-containing protein